MPGQQPTVYLHVGIAKTGTTYLQNLLWANRHPLKRAGLLYPERSIDHFRASIDLREEPFAGDPRTHHPGAWETLASAARSAPDRALISHETLARSTGEQAKRAVSSLEPAEVHLIVTVRDLARQIPAVWQERVKNRAHQTYGSYLNEIHAQSQDGDSSRFWRSQNVVSVLERWSEVPPDRVHVVTVPPAGAPRGLLWERFASVVGVAPEVAATAPPRANDSLGVAEAELLRRSNPILWRRIGDWLVYSRAVKHRFTREVLAGTAPEPRLRVPEAHRDWITERYQQMVDGLAAGGYDIVGDLADLEPRFGEGAVTMPTDIPEEQLIDVAAQSIAALVTENSQLRSEIRRARRAAARQGAAKPGAGVPRPGLRAMARSARSGARIAVRKSRAAVRRSGTALRR